MQQLNGSSETNNPNPQQQANSQPATTSTPSVESRPARNLREKPTQQGTAPNADEPKHLDLASLFNEDGGLKDENSDSHDDPSQPLDNVDAVSKRLGLKPEQVYAIKVPMPNGAEPLTIGELKDRVGELVGLDTREELFDQRRTKAEGELLRAQAEFRSILQLLPPEVVQKLPALTDKVRAQHAKMQTRERELTLEFIPEWQDEKKCVQDFQEMTTFLGRWGFDESFLQTVTDHRAIKFIRDMMLRDQRIQKAMKDVKTPERKTLRPSSKPTKLPARHAQPTSRRERVMPDQESRIMAFLNRE